MKVTIVAVGQRQPAWADAASAEYLSVSRRVQSGAKAGEGRKSYRQYAYCARAGAAARIRAAVPSGSALIALDERGRTWTTQQLADQLRRWRDRR